MSQKTQYTLRWSITWGTLKFSPEIIHCLHLLGHQHRQGLAALCIYPCDFSRVFPSRRNLWALQGLWLVTGNWDWNAGRRDRVCKHLDSWGKGDFSMKSCKHKYKGLGVGLAWRVAWLRIRGPTQEMLWGAFCQGEGSGCSSCWEEGNTGIRPFFWLILGRSTSALGW